VPASSSRAAAELPAGARRDPVPGQHGGPGIGSATHGVEITGGERVTGTSCVTGLDWLRRNVRDPRPADGDGTP
jgi:hypothetical protein